MLEWAVGSGGRLHCGPSSPPAAPTHAPQLLAGANYLSIKFDGNCGTHEFDSLTVVLPAPPLPPGWTLDSELASFGGPSSLSTPLTSSQPADQLAKDERAARRAEYQGDASAAYGLYLSLFSNSPHDPEYLLCAVTPAATPAVTPAATPAVTPAVTPDPEYLLCNVAERPPRVSRVTAVTPSNRRVSLL